MYGVNMISLDLFGDPVAKARPKFCRQGKFVRTYDPQDKLKEGIQWQLRSLYKNDPLTIPLALDIIFFMPISKSLSGIKKRQMANGIIAHVKKPDLDNLNKFYMDCMNKIVFNDDSQIVEIRAKKIYSNKSGTLIRIIPLSDEKRELLYENISRDIR
jgi:Holliday junction resolvase RusA-like endonuclease